MKEVTHIRFKDAAAKVTVEKGTIDSLKTAKGRKEWREFNRRRQEFIQSFKPEP
jgi:hypothetical protein